MLPPVFSGLVTTIVQILDNRFSMRALRNPCTCGATMGNVMSAQQAPAEMQECAAGNISIIELIEAADAHTKAGHIELARKHYDAWIQSNPGHPYRHVAFFNRSSLDTEAGDTEKAIEALRLAIVLNEGFLPAYINLGGLLERQGAA